MHTPVTPHSPTEAVPARTQRVVFPNALTRADRHLPYVWFRRNVLLFILYFLWKAAIAPFAGMTIYSAVCTSRFIVSMGNAQVPFYVRVYISVLALYVAYHTIVFRIGGYAQGEWLTLRNFVRCSLVDFPYVRHHASIFEEREADSLADRDKPMVPPDDKTLFVYHPHGVVACGFAANGVHSKRFEKSNAYWLISDKLFLIPFLGDLLRWLQFDDARKLTMVSHMKRDRNLCIMPGGFEEATLTARGKHRVYIKKRFGFIKLALQFGYKVAPVYTFGEEETFHALDYPHKLRTLFNKWKLPVVVFYGRPLCFFMPREDVELITVVGKPLELPTIENPTKEDVAKYHQLYVDALVGLFERNKHKYAVDPTVPLEVY